MKVFVIQPFDGGKFDKRYEDVFEPAIREANLEPYRVDRDPSISIPIESITEGISASFACLADITLDNPNVWFELGYAIAMQREVVLLCGTERQSKFPFDVQHRTVIKYSNESLRDFSALQSSIVARLNSIRGKEAQLAVVARMSPIVSVHGLDQHEIATLVTIAEEPDGLTLHRAKEFMERAGFTGIATTLGIHTLMQKGMIESLEQYEYNETYYVYRIKELGMEWLLQNTAKLKLQHEQAERIYKDGDVPF